MIKIPNIVKIGGLDFTVEEKTDEVRDNGRTGCSSGTTQKIIIDKDISQQLKETTFIHELLHQVDYVYTIGLSHQQVYLLEASIYAFLKNNPDMLDIN